MKKRYLSLYRLNHNFINNSKLRLKLVPTKINPWTQENRGWTYKKQRNRTRLTQFARNRGTNPSSEKEKKTTGRGLDFWEAGRCERRWEKKQRGFASTEDLCGEEVNRSNFCFLSFKTLALPKSKPDPLKLKKLGSFFC